MTDTFAAGFIIGILLTMVAFVCLIDLGLLPRYTVTCTDGRHIYVETGHTTNNVCNLY